MEQESVWNAVAEDWASFRSRTVDEVKDFLSGKKVAARGIPSELGTSKEVPFLSGKVLDLGCGSGRNFVKSDDLKFYGVDFSAKLLEIAEGKGYVELKKGTTDEIPYEDGFFDWVIFVRVLHCVDSEEKRRKSLEEVYRVLSPRDDSSKDYSGEHSGEPNNGGEAVISTIGPKNQRVKNKPKEGVIPWTVDGEKFERYNYTYDKDEFGDLLKSVGFEVVSLEEGKNIVAVVRKV